MTTLYSDSTGKTICIYDAVSFIHSGDTITITDKIGNRHFIKFKTAHQAQRQIIALAYTRDVIDLRLMQKTKFPPIPPVDGDGWKQK